MMRLSEKTTQYVPIEEIAALKILNSYFTQRFQLFYIFTLSDWLPLIKKSIKIRVVSASNMLI